MDEASKQAEFDRLLELTAWSGKPVVLHSIDEIPLADGQMIVRKVNPSRWYKGQVQLVGEALACAPVEVLRVADDVTRWKVGDVVQVQSNLSHVHHHTHRGAAFMLPDADGYTLRMYRLIDQSYALARVGRVTSLVTV